MKYCIALLCCLLPFIFVGCAGEAPPPTPPPQQAPPPPPEPTPEELYNQMLPMIAPFKDQLNNLGVSDAVMAEVPGKLRTEKGKYTATENGRQALSRITNDIKDYERRGKKEERWRLVKTTIETLDVLDPGCKNTIYSKDWEYTMLMLNKPRVKITGFLESEGDIYVWCKVSDPVSLKEEIYKVREGEEFHTRKKEDGTTEGPLLKMLRIIGDKHSVEFVYIPANITWTVLGPNETTRNDTDNK